jgi:hypothetical protein
MGFANYSKVQSFEDMAAQEENAPQEVVAETVAPAEEVAETVTEAKADNTEESKAE